MATSAYTRLHPTPQPTAITAHDLALAPGSATLLVTVFTLAAAVLRWYSLGATSIWIDEATSFHLATMPWWPFLRELWGYQGNMTLYYFLLRGWVHLGQSEAFVRSLSALLGVLTVPALYALATRMFDRTSGVIAAAMLALHSFHIQWSQEARAYSLFGFLLVVTAYFFVRAMESPHLKRYWAAFCVSAALCVYAHVFAMLILPAYALAIVFPRPFTVRRNTIAAVTVSFLVLITPISAFVVLRHSSQISWIPSPTLESVTQFLKLLTGQGGWLLAGIYFCLSSLTLVRSFSPNRPERERWMAAFLALWLILPPALTLALSAIKPLFFPRYMVMCVPALVLLAARGIATVLAAPGLRRPAAAAALATLLSLSAWGTDHYLLGRKNQTEDWRSAVSYILANQRAKDGAVFYIPNVYSYLYYVQRARMQHGVTTAPDVLFPTVPWHDLSRQEIQATTACRDRVWLILCNESVNPKALATVQSALRGTFQQRQQAIFPGEDPITVILYTQPVSNPINSSLECEGAGR